MPPDTFFAGPGLDRADALRGSPDRLAALASHPDAKELVWRDGLPAMDESGRLVWRDGTDGALFLGLDGHAPRYSPLAEPAGKAADPGTGRPGLIRGRRGTSAADDVR